MNGMKIHHSHHNLLLFLIIQKSRKRVTIMRRSKGNKKSRNKNLIQKIQEMLQKVLTEIPLLLHTIKFVSLYFVLYLYLVKILYFFNFLFFQ